ncbi:MAG: nucleoside hydrolase, partial [Ignavibacteria bacterium CG08_land_8_20_14_0_20_37_9]
RIVSMAGAFDRHLSEWNIRCDPIAAAIVFNSGIPMTVVGLDVTTRCMFNREHLNRLKACNRPIAKNLWKATELWSGRYPVLHDPL